MQSSQVSVFPLQVPDALFYFPNLLAELPVLFG